ncbi:hypothetical protein ACJDT4_11410 [Clostridium neuense]|uniref:Chorismate mutase n=1 Tax=Clostridium neuense TaxID=1728934 RepID=A0ABW8TET0_9CLOT
MERMPFKRPTDHYDEEIKYIDEKICELINKRKEISKDNPGYPPFDYIVSWAEKFNLYEEFLKSLFGALMNEKMYKPLIKPKVFKKTLPVLKCIEIDNHLFSITCIRQYSNASVVNFNVDWDSTSESLEDSTRRHTNFEMFIDEKHDCQMLNGTGGSGHFHYNFVVSPALPDDLSGIEIVFREYEYPFIDKTIGKNIIIGL